MEQRNGQTIILIALKVVTTIADIAMPESWLTDFVEAQMALGKI